MFLKAGEHFDIEQQLEWASKADEIVAEAANQFGIKIPDLIAEAIAQSVRLHRLSQPGVYEIVESIANNAKVQQDAINHGLPSYPFEVSISG